MVVPLRVGGGSRLKIIEALAARLPVVSTAVGAEGLEIVPGLDFDLADTLTAMTDAIVARLDKPLALGGTLDATRAKVAAHYDWLLLATRLERVWHRACQDVITVDQPTRLPSARQPAG